MSITRVGANQKYAAGWEKAFGGVQKSRATAVKPAAKPAAKPTATAKKKAASPKKSTGKRSK